MAKAKPEKAVLGMVTAALERANGGVKAAWSQYIIVHYRATGNLSPCCDAKDFYAAVELLHKSIDEAGIAMSRCGKVLLNGQQ